MSSEGGSGMARAPEPGTAVVTGAAGGIGAAVARALAGDGHAVALIDRDESGLEIVAKDLRTAGARAAALPADVADAAAVERAVDAAERLLGPVDVLVAAAGLLVPGRLLDLDTDDWRRAFAVNTDGVFHACRAAGRRMRERGHGSIVTVASNAAGVPRAGIGAYGAAKAAAMMLTRSLGLELAGSGVRCNIVCPGSTDTPMLRELLGAGDGPADLAGVVAGSAETFKVGIPLGRVADPADVADAVAFLCSPRAQHITMQALYVDGGATLRA